MKSPFARKSAPELPVWKQLLEEADLCASHAQDAAQCGRFCAACGLILTANALCARALESPSAKCELLAVEGAVASRMGFYQDEVDRLLNRAMQGHLQKGKL
ncbi:hypothetical protein IAD21_05635 [Abditibacteriota bacterium]|nr:hypothetical protein IAD21_05635 [Abditibacteriota bacterium]